MLSTSKKKYKFYNKFSYIKKILSIVISIRMKLRAEKLAVCT